jgi:uncharacterized protein
MAEVKMSRFIIQVPIEKDGRELIAAFQTMTTSLIVAPETVWTIIKNDPTQGEPGIVEALLQQGFLHRTATDEDTLLAAYKQQIVHDFTAIKTKTLITRLCNNACSYCIIKPEGTNMTPETALNVDRFCFELARKKRPREVEDVYTGGEALLNPSVLLESASRRCRTYTEWGIRYGFSVITNGSLITPALVVKLKQMGLTGLRVSIAGPASVHDRLRPLRDAAGNGGKSYDLILRNLEAISGAGVPIIVQTQYDSSSDDYLLLPEMLDDFRRRGIAVQSVAFTPIMPRRDETIYRGMTGDPAKLLFLMKEAEKRGYRQFHSPPANACMADIRSRITFDTDGSILACPSLQSGEMVYGHATSGIDFVAESQLIPRRFPEKCLTACALLPRCWGGCRLNALARGEDFNGIDCQADALWPILDEQVRQQAFAALSSGDVSMAKEAA